jgi:NAD(P)-dependent dehydrogenase (short-subunit alcohol dehydrogenase family)
MSNTKVNGKVAFITGANRGLGKQGIVVVLGSRDPKEGEAAAAKLRDEGKTYSKTVAILLLILETSAMEARFSKEAALSRAEIFWREENIINESHSSHCLR